MHHQMTANQQPVSEVALYHEDVRASPLVRREKALMV